MRKLRSLIKGLIPYQYIANKYDSNNFIKEYIAWKSSKINDIDSSNKYKTIVSVQGFGFSGSGAVIDLMREYESCQVLGGTDNDSVNRTIGQKFGEFDYIRHSGGFYDIEKHLGYNNVFINDGLINRFIKMVYYSNIYRNFPKSHPVFFEFLDSITELELLNLSQRYYNSNLYLHDRISSIFFLKEMSADEYRIKCKKCLNALLGLFHEEGKNILVADQICCDFEFDIERDKSYFDNLKSIIVYRDPRDIYYYAVDRNVEWIAHENVDLFIKWYNNILKKFKGNSTEFLLVRFEELITNYEDVVNRIEKYVGLGEHIYKFRNFDPQKSKKNVGIWKKSGLSNNDFEKIKKSFNSLCFE